MCRYSPFAEGFRLSQPTRRLFFAPLEFLHFFHELDEGFGTLFSEGGRMMITPGDRYTNRCVSNDRDDAQECNDPQHSSLLCLYLSDLPLHSPQSFSGSEEKAKMNSPKKRTKVCVVVVSPCLRQFTTTFPSNKGVSAASKTRGWNSRNRKSWQTDCNAALETASVKRSRSRPLGE